MLLEVCLNAIFLAFYVLPTRLESPIPDAVARDLFHLIFLLTVRVLTSRAAPQTNFA